MPLRNGNRNRNLAEGSEGERKEISRHRAREFSRSQVLVAYEFRLYPGDCGNHGESEGMM